MKKLLMKFFSILLSFFCIVGLGTPIYAEGETGSFSFKENNITMYYGEQHLIQFDLPEGQKVDSFIYYDNGVVDYDEEKFSITAKQYGDATIRFVIDDSEGNLLSTEDFYVSVRKAPTAFKWNDSPITKTINTSVEDYSKSFSLDGNYSLEPSDWEVGYKKLSVTVDDPDEVVTQSEENGLEFTANKAGIFTVTGTVDDELSDTTQVNVVMGNYATGLKNYFISKMIHKGDSFDVRQDIAQYLLPENGDFSDESFDCRDEYGYNAVDINGTVVTAKQYGNARVKATLKNGTEFEYYITVADEPTELAFTQKEYSYCINLDYIPQNDLVSNNNNSIQNVPSEEITFSVSDPEIAEVQRYGSIYFKKTGDVTVTAKYKDLTASCLVHVYGENEENPYAFESVGDTNLTINPGKSKKIEYTLGEKNSIDRAEFTIDSPTGGTVSDSQITFDKDTNMITAYEVGSYQMDLYDKLDAKCTWYIRVDEEPTWIKFDKKEYSLNIEYNHNLKYFLESDYNDAIRSVQDKDITFTFDNNDIVESFFGSSVKFKKEGDATLTAKYKDLTASCLVHVYEGEDPYEFTINNSYMKAHTGESKKIDYKLGKKNSIEKITIKKNNQDVADSQAKFDKNTQMFTAYEDGYYDLTLTDKLGQTNGVTVSVGPEATSFSFNEKEKIYTARENSWTYYNIPYTVEPTSAYNGTDVKFELVDGDSDILEFNGDSFFRIKKAGKVTIKGTTDNGLSDTMVIDARVGNYATGFDYNTKLRYSLKVGETINIKDDVEGLLEPKNEDLSDEKLTYSLLETDNQGVVSVSQDGTITALKNGYMWIRVKTLGGSSTDVTVAVMDKLNDFRFSQESAEVPLTSGEAVGPSSNTLWLSGYFTADPNYAFNGIDYRDVAFTSSTPEIGEVVMNGSSPVFKAYKEGITTLTAKYKGFTTTMDVDVYTPTPATSMDVPSEITIHKGFGKSVYPTYNKHAIKKTTSELVSGSDVVAVNSFDNGFTVEANKVGTAIVKVSSSSNPSLTKNVKVNVVDGYPDANVSMIDESTGEEFTSNGAYSLKVNQFYTIHIISSSNESPLENQIHDQIDNSGILAFNSGGGESDGKQWDFYYSFETIKSGTVTLEVYPGTKVTLRVGDAGFIDTPADTTPHNDDVQWLASTGISTGFSDGTFRPYAEVARCDMAAFIRRLAKNNNWLDAATWTPSEADWNTFSDIDKNSPHAEDVLWLAHAEISQGWDVGNRQKEFRPFTVVARCDMAAFLHRLASKAGVSDAATWKPSEADWTFADIDAGSPHAEDVLWLAHSGVSKGWDESNGTKTFRPLNNVARCDMAAFLHRLDNLK